MTSLTAFLITNVLLGVGLAMDAFSVSLANGLHEPEMKKGRMLYIAGIYGIFQFLMPMIGWICVHSFVTYFTKFEKFIPYIALLLLLYIGGKMLLEGIKGGDDEDSDEFTGLAFGTLMVQGIATSIDALSVGFTIAEYNLTSAVSACLIIGVVTTVICIFGLGLGKTAGTKLSGKADILGGVILIAIGIEIFIKGVF